MLPTVPHARAAHGVVLNVALAAVYVVVARLGLTMDAVGGFATLVWPSTGLAIAALMAFGYRLWPGVAAGAFVTNLTLGEPFAVCSGIALGNTLEAIAAVWAVRRVVGGPPSLARVKDMVAFIGLASVASSL